MKEIEDRSCLRFQARVSEPNYVRIFRGNGCFSQVGLVGGPQMVSLGIGCIRHTIIMHELLHAVGFHHEHTRSDRDDYVTIYLNNVQPGLEQAFTKPDPSQYQLLSPFDYESVMLYGSTSFARSVWLYTMTRKDGTRIPEVYEKTKLSNSDVYRLNRLYQCSSHLGVRG